jgi:hypothetical protein
LYSVLSRSGLTVIKNSFQAQKGSGLRNLLLDRFFHADGVHHQLQVGHAFGLVATYVAFDGFVSLQLVQVALGKSRLSRSEP